VYSGVWAYRLVSLMPYREQAIMKSAKIEPEYVAARYRRFHAYDEDYHHKLRFQYKFDYQWFWRTKVFDLGGDGFAWPTTDDLEKKVRDWLDLRTRSGVL